MIKKSAFFAGMFTLPQGPEGEDGLTDAKPFVIGREAARGQAFEHLITFLYDR